MKNHKLNCEKARDISIVETLKRSGHFPIREAEKEAWFLSPFRSETQASFKVDKQLNRWYDHGAGKGGNVIDLVMELNNFSISETLEFLHNKVNSFSFHKPSPGLLIKDKNHEILELKNLEHHALLTYLKSRKIETEIARTYCKEIHYKANGKNFFSIAFKNRSNGYETRNSFFKGCLGKKDITFLEKGEENLCIFEGFFDFLSYLTLFGDRNLKEDYIILNSVSLIEKISEIIKKYDVIFACLDDDESGKKGLKKIRQYHANVFDGSMFYHGFKDINEYLMNRTIEPVTE
ncbi:toprim domain-containing protein [Gaetbulibacter sp. M240]|uniref:toprim domain-containing protein n=1 Tax=Gaetbulibacter sp. M240 TaxID=3126511 RepID=UPI00374F1F54